MHKTFEFVLLGLMLVGGVKEIDGESLCRSEKTRKAIRTTNVPL